MASKWACTLLRRPHSRSPFPRRATTLQARDTHTLPNTTRLLLHLSLSFFRLPMEETAADDDPNDLELPFFDSLDSFPTPDDDGAGERDPLPASRSPLRRRRPLDDPTASDVIETTDLLSLSLSLLRLLLSLAADPMAAPGRALALLRDRVWPEARRLGAADVAVRAAVGAFCSALVGLVLLGLLAMAFVAGGLLVAAVVEEPLRFEEELVFDYTRESPAAVVPLGPSFSYDPCKGFLDGSDLGDVVAVGIEEGKGRRAVAVGKRLSVSVSLALPESDYNRKLGVFQVRADFLSSSGHIIASSSRPCMLHYKSSLVRFLQTLLKSGLLLAGYTSESQILKVEMKVFTEKTDPTACVRIIIQSRAQFRHGTGLPEIYAASLFLESELPLFKRILWNWRSTIFIWISLGLFLNELVIVLLFCRPLIIPKMTMGRVT